MRRWRSAVMALVSGSVIAIVSIASGQPVLGVGELAVFAVLASLVSPVVFPRSITADQARDLSARDGRPVVYWRPGCPYCLRLRVRLGRYARRAHWVDIWRDPAGAGVVRGVTGGDETVPTVIAEGAAHVNPDPSWLRARLGALDA